MAKLNIASINVRGLGKDSKCRIIHQWLKNNDAKIVFVQETFCQKAKSSFENKNWTIKHNFTDSAHSRGVAIMINNSLNFEILNIHKKDDARVILINAMIENVPVTLCNVYAPNDEYIRRDYFNTLKYWIARHTDFEHELILGGDFNTAINDNDRQNNNRGNKDVSRVPLKNLLKSLKLVDTWYIHNKVPNYTFTDPGTGSKSRIDYFFTSSSKIYKVKGSFLKYMPIPDHHEGVFLEYKLTNNQKGRGYWKLNAKLLEIEEYKLIVKEIAQDCRINYPMLNNRARWELFKIKVQEASIVFGVERAKKRKEYINKLQSEIEKIKKLESEGVIVDLNKKEDIQSKISEYYKEKDDGYLIRSKIKWIEEGEKSTKFFFNLEKSRQSSNVIRQIKDKNGNLQTEDNDILKAASDFYKNLFTTKNIDQSKIDEYLNDTNFINKLTEPQKNDCDKEITEQEIEKVIKNLKIEKSPGCDGLTPEFYKKLWPEFKDLFISMLHETYRCGELPYTLRKALLALLFKKGDNTLLKNYRPISLTNYDYKILCFVLANRMQGVLKDIILEDQTGYIKGRYIGTNARLLEDYFEHCESKQIPGILLYLDFEKAFDSIEWNFMMSVLEKFNFGEGFIKWVKILYKKPVISIKNNGWLSSDISLGRGVRQGCPLSALLFVLTVEVMAIRLRDNQNIRGFQCLDKNIKHSMYADDTTLLLSDILSLDYALDTVNEFSEVAGPKLNVEKTEGILLGPLKNTLNEHRGIKFTNDAVRCLGVYMGHNKAQCRKLNWDDKIEKMKIIFERWKSRHLTIFGKILIIKALAISKFIHTMSIICTPDDILKEIEKAIFKFLWDTHDRIKRNTLIGPKGRGGIKMLDIYSKDKALKIGWIRRLFTSNPNSDFVNMCLNKHGINIEYLIKCTDSNVNSLITHLGLPRFWAQVFGYMNECKTLKDFKSLNDSEILAEPIWLNKRFKFNKKPIFISNWVKSGILYVKDLFINNELIKEERIFQTLRYKHNWIAEYSKVKKIFEKTIDKFNPQNATFINIKNKWDILVGNNIFSVKLQKSTFYYNILIEKKFQKNYMEHAWQRDFEIPEINWENVYYNQVWDIKDRKLGEFNYKLLCNVICTKSNISKWNRNINDKCTFCNLKQTVKHLLFDCPRVKNLWVNIGTIINLNIRYKHIILGNIVTKKNEFVKNRNLFISFVAYSIYKFWVMAENGKISFNNDNLLVFVKKDLFRRTLYNKEDFFIQLCDKVCQNM